MPTATDVLLYTMALLLFIIHLCSPYLTYKFFEYEAGKAARVIRLDPLPVSSRPEKRSAIRRNVFDDQMMYLPPVHYDKQVVILSEENFSHFVAKNRYVMVAFYASWSPECRKLAPEYAEAAMELKGQVVLAKVYGDKEKRLAKKYGVQRYPILYFFVGGVNVDPYNSVRKRDAIVKWSKAKTAPGVYTITTTEQSKQILMTEFTIVLAFLDSLQGLESEELAAVSKLHTDVLFYQTTNASVAKSFHINPEIKSPSLILLEKDSNQLSLFDGPFTTSEIAYFVSVNKIPSVTLKSSMKQSFGKNFMEDKLSSQSITISETELVLVIGK